MKDPLGVLCTTAHIHVSRMRERSFLNGIGLSHEAPRRGLSLLQDEEWKCHNKRWLGITVGLISGHRV